MNKSVSGAGSLLLIATMSSAQAQTVDDFPYALDAPCVDGAFTDFSNTTAISPTAGSFSLSATEASTTQALEIISQRRQKETRTCPSGFVRAGGQCKAISAPATASYFSPPAGLTTTPKALVRPASKERMGLGATSGPYGDAGSKTYGGWVEGFYDYEGRTNVPRGNGEVFDRDQRSAGLTVGADRTFELDDDSLVQLGVLGGYTDISQRFSDDTENSVVDTTFSIEYFNFIDGVNRTRDLLLPVDHDITTSTKQDINGGNVGLYGSFFKRGFFSDALVKVDFFDLERRTQTAETFNNTLANASISSRNGCIFTGVPYNPLDPKDPNDPDDPPSNNPAQPDGTQFDIVNRVTQTSTETLRTSFRNYVLADNIGYRYDLSPSYWIEPTGGFRYTFADFDSNADRLGLKDGHALRIQGGARVGTTQLMGDYIWTGSIGALLYSDVLIDGFVINGSGFSSSAVEDDEGELRVLGVVRNELEFFNGVSAYTEVNGRGGEDLWAVGGKVGGRVEW